MIEAVSDSSASPFASVRSSESFFPPLPYPACFRSGLGLRDVLLVAEARRVADQALGDVAGRGHGRALERRHDAVVVDRVGDRLTHPHVLQRPGRRVQHREQVLERRPLLGGELRVGLVGREELRRHAGAVRDLARLQQLRLRGRLRHELEERARVVLARPAAPVALERVQLQLVLLALLPRPDDVRAGAGVMRSAEPLDQVLRARGLRVVDVRGVGRRRDDVERRGVLEVEDERQRRRRRDRLDRVPDVGGAALELDRALDRGLRGLRRHGTSGVELHALPQRERPRGAAALDAHFVASSGFTVFVALS